MTTHRRATGSRQGVRVITYWWITPAYLALWGWTVTDVRAQAVVVPTAQTLVPARATRGADEELERMIAVRLEHVTLKEALRTVGQRAGLSIGYSKQTVPVERRVSLVVDKITIRDALRLLLQDTDLEAVALAPGLVIVQPAGAPQVVPMVVTRRQQADGIIVGRVVDAESGALLDGVTVMVLGGALKTQTGGDGTYILRHVPVGPQVLGYTRLGYVMRRHNVAVIPDSTAHVDFSLTRSPQILDQVVTTATGDRHLVELGNTIGTIEADSVVAREPVTTLSDIISARVAGVQVFVPGGLTGSVPQINIRGQASLSQSNQPIVIIDGIRVDNSVATYSESNSGGIAGGRLNDVAPDQIQSIEVVKGPSAATLYGTDAANGVIVITTKHGGGGHPRWTVFGEGGALTYDKSRFADNYQAWGRTTDSAHTLVNCTLLLRESGGCTVDSLRHFSPLKDPATTPIGVGSRQSVGAQVSGGTDTRYFYSGSYQDEIGILKMPAADRTVWAPILGAAGFTTDQLHPNAARDAAFRGNIATALGQTGDVTLASSVDLRNTRIPYARALLYGEVGPGYRDANDGWAYGFRPGDFFLSRNEEDVMHWLVSGSPNWRPVPWLRVLGTAGLDFSSSVYDDLTPANEGLSFTSGTRSNVRTAAAIYSANVGAIATNALSSRLTSRLSIGGQYTKNSSRLTEARAQQLALGAQTVAGGATTTGIEGTTESVVAGGYTEEQLGWNDRLFVTGAARADGGSTFGADFKTALYPKASISWLLSDEPFWPRQHLVTSLRLRAAYGASGVQPSATAALALDAYGGALVDGAPTTGVHLISPGNPQLKPERQQEIEGGADLDLFQNRLHLEGTYYHKNSTDALEFVQLPTSVGGFYVEKNIGAVRNWGLEGLANATVIAGRRVQWDVGLNASANHNRVITLGPGVPGIPQQFFASVIPGRPLYSEFDYPILGYHDANGDGMIEPNEVQVGQTLQYVGQTYPGTQMTFTTTISLFDGRLRFSSQIDHRSGFVILNTQYGSCVSNSCLAVTDPHASLADQAQVIALVATNQFSLLKYYMDGSFSRWREASITYTLPPQWSAALRARAASVVLSGRNLALWTRFPGDPEINSEFQPTMLGPYFNNGGVPPVTYWLARINLTL